MDRVYPQRAQVRRQTEFHPTVWGDFFLTIDPCEETIKTWSEEAEKKVEEVRRMFKDAILNHENQLHLIDITQKLGIAYKFEEEIEEALKHIHNYYYEHNSCEDLHTIALRFRLLRQEGHHVSCEIFKKFTDGEGNFKESILSDVKGLLSLYEASHLSVHGEDILDKALEFTKSHLNSIVTQVDTPLSEKVNHALDFPLRRSVSKYEEWFYISNYESEESCNETLLRLGKLNFNIVQQKYQMELRIISTWWEELNLKEKLPFARDRMIESYFWAFSLFPEPEYSFARIFAGKATSLGGPIDDVYDVHGTIEELELFTSFIERWDIGNIEDLPDYMKTLFYAIDGVVKEIEEHTTKEGRTYCSIYEKEAIKRLCKAYLNEARWFNEDIAPKLEDYRRNAVHGTALPYITISGFCGMGDAASLEIFEWVFKDPKILVALSDYGRLMNDMVSHEFEQKRGDVASSVECYMKQHGVSKEEAYTQLRKFTDNDWKDLNEEMLKKVDIPKRIRTHFLNMFRTNYVVYKDIDSFTFSDTCSKDMLTILLAHPIAFN